jgi:hypothetical protein
MKFLVQFQIAGTMKIEAENKDAACERVQSMTAGDCMRAGEVQEDLLDFDVWQA